MKFTKRNVREALELNDAGLVKFFGVTAGAVSQWPDDEPIPTKRQWECKAKRPDLFVGWGIVDTSTKPAPDAATQSA